MLEKIYCQIRKQLVVATPEEVVRQNLIHQMTQTLEYPLSLIAIERGLKEMPHVTFSGKKIPNRRADIICFCKGIDRNHDLYPLLLIECKAVPLSEHVVGQVIGYNHYVKAFFIAVANGNSVKTGWNTGKGYQFVEGLPSFSQLKTSLENYYEST